MKKTNIKRLAAFTASILAVAALAVPMTSVMTVDAAGEGSITITDTSGATTSAVKAYQIFTANVSGEIVTITGWGAGIDVTKLATAIAADSVLSTAFDGVTIADTATSAQAVADVLSGLNTTDDEDIIESFAQVAAQCVTGDGHAATNNSITGLDYGYYVAVDSVAASNGKYESYSLGMLKVVSSTTAATVTVKRDFPTFDKLIGDINDSEADAEISYNEAADHDIGDKVPFKLIATVPSNIADYDAYKMVFHDDLEKTVFSFNDDVVVKYYASATDTTGTDVTDSFTPALSTATDAVFDDTSKTDGTKDFTVTCNDITAISGVAAGGRFEVTYTATLTEDADLGDAGNWNGAYLEYSNNPNYTGSGDSADMPTANSPEDYVVAFTYQTVIDKINGVTNEALAGANFTLYKVTSGTTSDNITEENGVYTIAADNIVSTYTAELANGNATFVFEGLDDGKYVLIESTVPEGYDGIEPMIFTVTATETMTDGSEALEIVDVDNNSFSVKDVYTVTTADGKITATTTDDADAVNSAVYAQIANQKGSSLPSTGGIGTTLFYIGGGALALGAGVLLVSKKRMSNK